MKYIFYSAATAFMLAFAVESNAQTKQASAPEPTTTTEPSQEAAPAEEAPAAIQPSMPADITGSNSTATSLEKPVKKPKLIRDKYGYYHMNSDQDRGSNASMNGYDPGYSAPSGNWSATTTDVLPAETDSSSTTTTTTAPAAEPEPSIDDAWGNSSGSSNSFGGTDSNAKSTATKPR